MSAFEVYIDVFAESADIFVTIVQTEPISYAWGLVLVFQVLRMVKYILK